MICNLSEVWLTLEIAKSDVSPLSLDDIPGLLNKTFVYLVKQVIPPKVQHSFECVLFSGGKKHAKD